MRNPYAFGFVLAVVSASCAGMALFPHWVFPIWLAGTCLLVLGICVSAARSMPEPPQKVRAGICMDCRLIYRPGFYPASHGLCEQCAAKRRAELAAGLNR